MDNLDRAYKIVKLSSSLVAFSLLYVIFIRPFLAETIFQGLNDFFIAVPILASGAISCVGFVFALIGSQYGQRNAKKRFFGLFGNLVFALILIALLVPSAPYFFELLKP